MAIYFENWTFPIKWENKAVVVTDMPDSMDVMESPAKISVKDEKL